MFTQQDTDGEALLVRERESGGSFGLVHQIEGTQIGHDIVGSVSRPQPLQMLLERGFNTGCARCAQKATKGQQLASCYPSRKCLCRRDTLPCQTPLDLLRRGSRVTFRQEISDDAVAGSDQPVGMVQARVSSYGRSQEALPQVIGELPGKDGGDSIRTLAKPDPCINIADQSPETSGSSGVLNAMLFELH